MYSKKNRTSLISKLISIRKSKITQQTIASQLTGKTLMIYFAVLNKGTVGVREIQRNLELSSPSVAKYHLEKLIDLNLVENQNGSYILTSKAEIPALTSWVLIGKNLFPKIIFIALFLSCIFIGYLAFIFSHWNKDSIFVFLLGIFSVIYTWFEAINQFRNKPI